MDRSVGPREQDGVRDVTRRVPRAGRSLRTSLRLAARQKWDGRRHQGGGAGATQEDPTVQLSYLPARRVSLYAAFDSTVSRVHESGKYSALAQFSVRLP